jgi:hypothetical protein
MSVPILFAAAVAATSPRSRACSVAVMSATA